MDPMDLELSGLQLDHGSGSKPHSEHVTLQMDTMDLEMVGEI